ncbi:heme exporter protein CcmD [Herminiimonas aquatilis]|uniref:Heme exporter protein D n=1 Tax=Herminiimonas aquatilis TaxID=345342 RepID=A0ABW2J674_9BURK
MNWNSAAEFLAMGGYGLYVWGSFAVTAMCLMAELISLRLRRKAALAVLDDEAALKKEMLNEKPL